MKCPVCFTCTDAKKRVKEQIPVISKKEAEFNEKVMLLGGLAIGFTVGAVVGSVAAALAVPKSGEETRRDIMDKTDNAVDGVKEGSAKVVDKVKNAAGEVVDKVKEKINGFDEDDVVVEYTIRYDDEGEAEECCCCKAEAEAEAEEAEDAAKATDEAPEESEESESEAE